MEILALLLFINNGYLWSIPPGFLEPETKTGYHHENLVSESQFYE